MDTPTPTPFDESARALADLAAALYPQQPGAVIHSDLFTGPVILPFPYTGGVTYDLTVGFGLLERLAILVGFPVRIKAFVMTENPTGNARKAKTRIVIGNLKTEFNHARLQK